MSVTNVTMAEVISWIQNYATKAGTDKLIIGLSGGIDSAVVASLCVRAVGKENVIGVLLPNRSNEMTPSVSEERAIELANKLGIQTTTIPIFFLVTEISAKTQIIDNKDSSNLLRMGNIAARTRMIILYDQAAEHKGLVIGTTNKSEQMIGYFTKYGDGGVDFEPLLEFYKTEVYEIAHMLGDIPNNTIMAKPSAELWNKQTDEDELGISYEVLDKVLHYLDATTGPSRLAIPGNNEAIVSLVQRLLHSAIHKTNPIPHFVRKTYELKGL